MANAFNKLLNAAKIAEEGTLGMMGLLQQRDATNAANQLALLGAQQKTAEHNLAVNQQKADVAKSIYESFNSQLAELEKAITADSSLKDNDAYRRQYNRVSKGRDNALKDFQRIVGIPVNSGLEVFDLVKAARSEIPADKRKFVPGTTEDILKKSFPSFTGNWQDAYDIWQLLDLQEGMQGSSTAEAESSDLLPRLSGAGAIAQSAGTVGDLALDVASLPFSALKALYTGSGDDFSLFDNVSGNPVQDYLEGVMGISPKTVTKNSTPTSSKSVKEILIGTPEMNQQGGESPVQVVQDALAVDPDNNPSLLKLILDTMIPPAGASDQIPDDFRNLRTNEFGQLVPTDGSMSNVPNDFRDMGRDQYGNLVETFATGETSQLINPAEVEELQLMDKRFGTGTSGLMSLSDELGSGGGGGQVSEEAANFIRKYMQIVKNSNVDEAGKRTGSAFNLLPVEVQTEIVTILEQSGIGEVNSPIPLGAASGPYQSDPESQRLGGILGMLGAIGYPMGQQIGASLGMSPHWLFKNRWGGMSPPLAALAATLAPRTANAPTETGTPLTSEQLKALANQ